MRTDEQTTYALSPANLPITRNKDTTGKDWGITLAIRATKQNKRYFFCIYADQAQWEIASFDFANICLVCDPAQSVGFNELR